MINHLILFIHTDMVVVAPQHVCYSTEARLSFIFIDFSLASYLNAFRL